MLNLFSKIAKIRTTPPFFFLRNSHCKLATRACNAVKSDSYNCPIITLRHVYDNLIVARKARNYMSTDTECSAVHRKRGEK